MAAPALRVSDCCNAQSRHATMQLLVQDEHKGAAQRMLVPYPFIGNWQPDAVRLVVLCAIGRPTQVPAADGALHNGVYPTASCEAALVKVQETARVRCGAQAARALLGSAIGRRMVPQLVWATWRDSSRQHGAAPHASPPAHAQNCLPRAARCRALQKLVGPRSLFHNRQELAAALQEGRLFVAQVGTGRTGAYLMRRLCRRTCCAWACCSSADGSRCARWLWLSGLMQR
jgi:hypothetical protein